MPEPETLTMDGIALLLVWTAIAVYLLAFVAYAIDLAQRSVRRDEVQRVPALVAANGEATAHDTDDERPTLNEVRTRPGQRQRLLWARIGTVLTGFAFIFHLAGTIGRGIAADRVPWANMYEFALTGTLLVVAVYMVVLRRYDLRFLGSFLIGMVALLLGGATLAFYVEITPLMDPLKSVWLVIHVFVASLGTALFAISCGLSATQLMQARRERRIAAKDEGAKTAGAGYLRTLPTAETLESLAYRFAIVGFIFWTFTLVAGSIWANDSWGRYWGFDTKEVWTFVIWVLYAGYIHARATRGWRGNPSAWLSIVGFTAVLFNFTIVNVFFKGLHAYSGLN
ncbi:c-type cytochrome biogenesis protein CcsB [Microbacterium sp. SD291]|uniref:c-type cytochrome biogenesis protein CcsB n=1 Tax=Microbacterium sp. SD291 TaxID=2782007 RepID=UPI001A95DE55|nr:c-type cytochrome biogenesis protein CcsB [Microbacterium sp. SD291]MBO0981889.1 c-type cytochrome biogenesis protein CcsB [Microbacterium sp. SD291]